MSTQLRSVYRVCVCRTCGKQYDPNKSRSDWQGYCSQSCMRKKARELGWRPKKKIGGQDEYDFLKPAGLIGPVFAPPPPEPEPTERESRKRIKTKLFDIPPNGFAKINGIGVRRLVRHYGPRSVNQFIVDGKSMDWHRAVRRLLIIGDVSPNENPNHTNEGT
jgi:hypothetical protein